MGKGKKKKPISPKKSIQSLQESRDGGQIALRGYTYQFLYACYLMLTNQNENTIFQLEGIEDVDRIEKQDGGQITHIQLKYSVILPKRKQGFLVVLCLVHKVLFLLQ